MDRGCVLRLPALAARSLRARWRVSVADRRGHHVSYEGDPHHAVRSRVCPPDRAGRGRHGGRRRLVAARGRARRSRMSAAALWERLAAAGLVTGEMPADTSSPTPWYVRVMLCVAGFIAALFLMAFVGAGLMFVVESAIASAVAGAVLIGAAVAIFRGAPRSDFASTFALALSMLGQVFV